VAYVEAEGEAAFYGPKIDIQVHDAAGREDTLSTIQLDFHQPGRFSLSYVDGDSQRRRPVIVHRSLVGSMERLFAYLIEVHQGAFPACATLHRMATAVYLRLSQDRTGLELGIDRQRGDCLTLAQQRGWASPVEYFDNDISASTGRHRPGYSALVNAIRRGEITRVVVWHNSRIWRNRRERADGIELFKTHAVTLAAVKGPELDMATAYGRGLAGLIGEFDTLESEVKSERVKAEALQRAQQGRPHGGTRPYGWTRDGGDLVPAEAAVIRGMFDQVLSGVSLTGIAERLNRDQVLSPTGRRWRFTQVRSILLRPRNAGLRILDGVRYPAAGPAVVDVATWEAVRRFLTDPDRRTHEKSTARKWLGTGLYGCARCPEVTVRCAYSSDPPRYWRVYRCPKCGRKWRGDPLDEFVTLLVEERLSRPDVANLLPRDRPDLDKLQREAAGIRARLRTLATDYVRLGLSESEVTQAATAGRARLAEIEAASGADTAAGALASVLATEDPVQAFRDIEELSRRQAAIRCLFTITLDAPPKGRRWDPERFVLLAPAAP
jgi:site-specific DNA recombinase